MTSNHVTINRDYWNGMAEDWVAAGERLWQLSEPQWGIWDVSNKDCTLLPEKMTGMHAVELGCGTGYVSGWMAKRGAVVTGIDISKEQLETAQRLDAQHGSGVTFVERNAEDTGLPGAHFDFAISEYGAAIWCDPNLWLPEAHRLLKPGGTLVFLGNHPLTLVTTPLNGAPSDHQLHRPYRGLTGADWTNVEIDPGGIEFNLTMSAWVKLFHKIGFQIVDYHEIYAPKKTEGVRFSTPAEWAQSYPSEQVWCLKKISP